ncbi:MAG TPA: acetoacetate decarboxylase family protein [Anaeromyxobacteraceae bacterium]|nr:acetoacetate decarboxylase family protein [Anaeromyxobacteraceae bacterium]
MPKGYTLPRTPLGRSSLVPAPPWHYAGDCLAVEYRADAAAVRAFLPERLEPASGEAAGRACAYFVEWQAATDEGEEYLDPARSQYCETIFLVAASWRGEPVSFCPFIFVDQDVSLLRGWIQGWPKMIGTTRVTRTSPLASRAAPALGPGGRFGATLASKERRLAEAVVTLRETSPSLPQPGFARAVNVRHFPSLARGRHGEPALHELVQLRSRDAAFSTVWKGEASLQVNDHPYLELPALRPLEVLAGYRFSFAMTVDDLALLEDLRER